MHLHNRRQKLVASLLLFAVFAHVCILSVPQAFAQNWYNANWQYRKQVNLLAASDAGTYYQLNLTVHYGSGSDSGYDVYLNSHCQTDFDDIRITDGDGETLLDIWLLEKSDLNYAIFWFEVIDDLNSNQIVFLYYGNDEASSVSNHDNTFKAISDVGIVEFEFEQYSTNSGDPKFRFYYNDSSSITYVEETTYVNLPVAPGVVYSINKTMDATHIWLQDGGFTSEHTARTDDARIRGNTLTGNTITDRVWLIFHYTDSSHSPPVRPCFAESYHVDTAKWTEWTSNVQDSDDVYAGLGTYQPINLNILWEVTNSSQLRKYVDPEPTISGYGSEEEYALAYVTFYQNISYGYFSTNCTLRLNGTQTLVNNLTVLRLEALPSGTYGFANFTWDSSSTTFNRYNLTITGNTTIWMYLISCTGGGVSGISKEFVFAGVFLLLLIFAPIIVIVIWRR